MCWWPNNQHRLLLWDKAGTAKIYIDPKFDHYWFDFSLEGRAWKGEDCPKRRRREPGLWESHSSLSEEYIGRWPSITIQGRSFLFIFAIFRSWEIRSEEPEGRNILEPYSLRCSFHVRVLSRKKYEMNVSIVEWILHHNYLEDKWKVFTQKLWTPPLCQPWKSNLSMSGKSNREYSPGPVRGIIVKSASKRVIEQAMQKRLFMISDCNIPRNARGHWLHHVLPESEPKCDANLSSRCPKSLPILFQGKESP